MKKFKLAIPPIIVTFIFGVIIWALPRPYLIHNNDLFIFLSFFLLAVGTIWVLLGVLEFRKMKTTVNPIDLENCRSLVTSGIYEYTRNPMYIGFLFWLLSLVVYLRNPIACVGVGAFIAYMNWFQIIPEEHFMEERFGEEYYKYKRRVRRWF